MDESVGWETLYRAWCDSWQGPDGARGLARARPPVNELVFEVRDDGYTLPSGMLDWWPTHDLHVRRESVIEKGTAALYWRTPPGHLTSAEFLVSAGTNDEHVAMVWISAFLLTAENDVVGSWPELSQTFRRCKETAVRALRKSPVGEWHHSVRNALPESPITTHLTRMMSPSTPEDLVELARLHTTAVLAHWRLVLLRAPGSPSSRRVSR